METPNSGKKAEDYEKDELDSVMEEFLGAEIEKKDDSETVYKLPKEE